MHCEHPGCSLERNTICKYHCHLSVCEQHRIEHEKNLLIEFEKELDNLSNPISTLLNKSRLDLQKSEESRQYELNRINSLFDHHLLSIDKRLKFCNTTNELILNERQQLIHYKNGDKQLTKENYQEIENLSKQIQTNLSEHYQLNNQISNNDINSWIIQKENNIVSKEIEYIELSDSENESESQYLINKSNETTPSLSVEHDTKQDSNSAHYRGVCPLTQYGVYGLNKSHNLSYLCSKTNTQPRYLYQHFTHSHRLKSSIAYQLVKAIRNGSDPLKTEIFPQDNTRVYIEDIQCPFDNNSIKFNKSNSIPNTPCHSVLVYHGFKAHLRTIHSITKKNAELIYNAMKDYGTISHVQFEEDLCEM